MAHPKVSSKNQIYTITVIGFIFSLHVVIPMYSNSSFLSLFASADLVSYIYMAGAAVSILGFLISPEIIRHIGNYRHTVYLILIQIVLYYGLISLTSPVLLTIFFILQIAVVSLIALSLDIFLEVSTKASNSGRIRGLYTAVLNASWLIGPLIGSMLINGEDNFRATYVGSLAILFPLLYLVYKNFPRFHDPDYRHLSPWQLLKKVSTNKNWRNVFVANLILQTFYSWMVVYSPLYLNKTIGFDWAQIGIILVIMLIPFPTIQYPLGRLADLKYGEKEIMAAGFTIMGIATIFLSFYTGAVLLAWALMLFLTRVGAAATEIMIETYFFKTVSAKDTAVLGAFRITRPISYFIAPAITLIGLSFTTNQYLFVIIGVMCLVGLYPTLRIRDTK